MNSNDTMEAKRGPEKPRKAALITGASSGIGYELARLCAQDGYNLVLAARSLDRLNDIAEEFHTNHGSSVKVISADLSKPGSAGEIIEDLRNNSIEIDILINNAGFGLKGEFAETEERAEREMMQLNMISLLELTKKMVPAMKVRGRG